MSRQDREKWNRRYAARGDRMGEEPRTWLERNRDLLPTKGRALDLAAGEGQNAVFLAGLGLDVSAVDISSVGLAKARERAQAGGVALHTLESDLERDPAFIAPESYDLILCFRYLQRDLAPGIEAGLRPGGLAVLELPTRKTLERRDKPAASFLVEAGELANWFVSLRTLRFEEEWENDVNLSRIVAQK